MDLKKSLSAISMLCIILSAQIAFAQEQMIPDEIVIDQFGYREQARKIAVGRWSHAGPFAVTIGLVRVIDETTGESVFEGRPTSFNGTGANSRDAASGDRIWHFDFSSVTAPGRYHIRLDNIRSYSFFIGNGVYNNVLKAAVKTFYYQRAGIAKPAQFAGEWSDGMQFEQDKRTRDFFRQNDASTERDLSGGWFDAGDYNKYTKWTADYIAEMFLMYEENPAAFTDDFEIPESGNGIPDIIDEAIWGLDWLLRMQNEDGSMLSVQGLAHASPPSSAVGPSFYGPPNATAAFGSVRAFAIAARMLDETGYADADYVNRLKTAAVKAWEWGTAHPDSIFHNNCGAPWNKENCPNYDSRGLAAGNQEMDNSTGGRDENIAAAAWYLFELTDDETLLPFVEERLPTFPLFAWGGSFMDHYRHSMHMLYIRYINDPRGNQTLKNDIRSRLSTAFNGNSDFNSPNGYATDGYRAFIKDYNWGSNKAKADYGLTFYKWHTVNASVNQNEFRERAEGYLHYIHGVNPFNMVFLTNMNRYGATRSQKEFYHTWFGEGTNWSSNPAPGFLPGGPNSRYKWDKCCPAGCDSAENNAKCFAVDIPDSSVTPPAKMYVESNIAWPINTWEITENSNGYQLGYIRLLSKFADWSSPALSARPNVQAAGQKTGGIRYKRVGRGIELRVKDNAEVNIFGLNGALVSRHKFAGGVHTVSLAKMPKGVYMVRMAVDGERKVLRIPVLK